VKTSLGFWGRARRAGQARTGEEDGERVAIAAEFEVLADQLVQKQLIVGERRPHVVLSCVWSGEASACQSSLSLVSAGRKTS